MYSSVKVCKRDIQPLWLLKVLGDGGFGGVWVYVVVFYVVLLMQNANIIEDYSGVNNSDCSCCFFEMGEASLLGGFMSCSMNWLG